MAKIALEKAKDYYSVFYLTKTSLLLPQVCEYFLRAKHSGPDHESAL